MFLKNSFYYLPKNSYTFEVGYNQLNKYFLNNPLKYFGFDYTLEVCGKDVNVYWEYNKDDSNIVNLHYKLSFSILNKVGIKIMSREKCIEYLNNYELEASQSCLSGMAWDCIGR